MPPEVAETYLQRWQSQASRAEPESPSRARQSQCLQRWQRHASREKSHRVGRAKPPDLSQNLHPELAKASASRGGKDMPQEVAKTCLQRWQSQASRASRDGRAKTSEVGLQSTSNVVDSLDQNNLDSLVSPSPLVFWHVDGPTASSRPLFSLTPLPRPKGFSSRLQGSYISVPEKIILTGVASHLSIFGDMRDDLLEDVETNPCSTLRFVSLPKVSKRECFVLVMTKCHHKDNHGVCKSTPLPVAVENFSGSQNSDSSSSQVSEHLALKYPKLFGLKPASQLRIRRKPFLAWLPELTSKARPPELTSKARPLELTSKVRPPELTSEARPPEKKKKKNLEFCPDHQIVHSGNLHCEVEAPVRNAMEPMPQKMVNRPIEKFHIEILPLTLAKSIPAFHHKLLSLIKSTSCLPFKNAAHIMKQLLKLSNQTLKLSPRPKMPPVGFLQFL
ncbi:hypothetical protein F0562_001821 [Nyssa sinensis]|uniref:Uncharacterized protein n=1 Tax=Nyssa sinensis TaxID=561372 RepID=A0A5J5C453_9ASTE|nr:hypothetical protein F0562_001821 [Nyssa sinensis]